VEGEKIGQTLIFEALKLSSELFIGILPRDGLPAILSSCAASAQGKDNALGIVEEVLSRNAPGTDASSVLGVLRVSLDMNEPPVFHEG
jgi:hypothetical protein